MDFMLDVLVYAGLIFITGWAIIYLIRLSLLVYVILYVKKNFDKEEHNFVIDTFIEVAPPEVWKEMCDNARAAAKLKGKK